MQWNNGMETAGWVGGTPSFSLAALTAPSMAKWSITVRLKCEFNESVQLNSSI